MNTAEPRILDYGPQRLIGISRVCKTSAECHDVWAGENGFQARAEEIRIHDKPPYFGICRCAQGAEQGAFEYVAATLAADGAPVPEGMIEVILPAAKYAVFPVTELSDIGRAWGYTSEWSAAHPEWNSFCDGNPEGCGCIATPAFEFYPPGFNGGELFIYMPIRPSA